MKTNKKVSARGPGYPVQVHYLGAAKKPECFTGAATRQEYFFGGRINLGEVDNRDLATGQSFAPGLLELRGERGEQLFEIYISHREAGPEEESADDRPQGDQD